MPRVPVHTIDDAPEGARDALERQSERVGKTINIFAEMAHAPAVLNLYDEMETLLGEQSSLEPATREAIHLTVANVNGCEYCQAAYTGAAKAAGFSVEQTLQIRQGYVEGDERLSALLPVARELVANKGDVDDTTWKEATEAGWSERELLETYADAVRTIYTNYFNHFVGTELDIPEAPAL